jgi:alkylglycerol monooxygenase
MLNTIALLIPVFLLVVVIEGYVSIKNQDGKYTVKNSAMNLAIGAIDQVCSLFYFTALFLVLTFVYDHFRFFEMRNSWKQWIIAYVAVDFLSYWYHRFSHRVNILWAGHVTHHSSDHFNFSNGFRTSFFQGINRIIFWSCLPLFGFSPLVLVITLKVSGIYDFLLHSAYIPKLGFLEKILITPSLHRVHHGKNDIYIDKNYGSTFLIWDQLFGTYQEETETVVYGIKSSYVDNNPFHAIGHYYSYLWNTIRITPRWQDKFLLLIMPPDWKPAVKISAEENKQSKNSKSPSYLVNYSWFQIVCCASGLIAMLVYKDFLSRWELLLYGVIGVTAISNSAMIINDNIRENFTRWESVRLVVLLILVCATLVLHSKVYILAIAFFLLISLFLNGIGNTQQNTSASLRSN